MTDPDRYAAIYDAERRAAQQDGMRLARERAKQDAALRAEAEAEAETSDPEAR